MLCMMKKILYCRSYKGFFFWQSTGPIIGIRKTTPLHETRILHENLGVCVRVFARVRTYVVVAVT